MVYLSSVKIFRNFHLISAGFSYLYILFRYHNYLQEDFLIALIFNFIALFVISLVELAGHVIVADDFADLIKLDDEDEKLFKRKRFDLLFGTRFYITISVFSIISLGMTYFSFRSLITSGDIFLNVMQIVYLLIAVGLYLLIFSRTMKFGKITNPSLLLQAVDYYETAELLDEGFKLLEDYLEGDPDNIALLSKMALLHTKKGNYDETLKYATKVLDEIDEKNYDVPHMTARAHMLRAVCLNAKEDYEEAYKEVTKTLKISPENNAARKLRRDLRRKIKQKDSA
jgi:tetratricopeptide (TPR) repeat protein